MNLSKDNMKKIAAIILFAVVVFLAIQNIDKVYEAIDFIWGIVSPFALGILIAFILNIPMNFFEKKIFKNSLKAVTNEENGSVTYVKKKYVRPVSIFISVILVFAVITGIVLVVIPQLSSAVSDLIQGMEQVFPQVQSKMEELFKNNSEIRQWISGINLNFDKILDTAIDFMKSGAGNVLSGTFYAAKAVASGIFTFFIGMIFSLYMLAKKETLLRQVKLLMQAFLPNRAAMKIQYVARLCNETFSSFITVQCLEALILGSMFFVTMSIIGLPYPLLISVLVAFMALIPIFGAFISCIVGGFLILMVSPMDALIFVIMFIILQQLEANLVYPRVVGSRVGLSPIWVLTAVTVGSSLMGIPGMLFFIPLTSVIYTLLKDYTYYKLKEKKENQRKAARERKNNTGDDKK